MQENKQKNWRRMKMKKQKKMVNVIVEYNFFRFLNNIIEQEKMVFKVFVKKILAVKRTSRARVSFSV